MLKIVSGALVALAVTAAGGATLARTALPDSATSPQFAGHQLAGQARVSLVKARAIALKARPGAITDEELEREGGGSGLRYSFDVRSGRVVYEVGVDARTGKVLEVSHEGDHPD